MVAGARLAILAAIALSLPLKQISEPRRLRRTPNPVFGVKKKKRDTKRGSALARDAKTDQDRSKGRRESEAEREGL